MIKPLRIRKLSKSMSLLSLGFAASSLLASGTAFAQIDADLAAELRAQIAALSSRLEQLENENAEMHSNMMGNHAQMEETQAVAQATSWADKISLSGDLRPRYENIDNAATESDRNRNRIRARVAINADLSDNWSATVGMASGGADPISTNQTLGGGGTTKDLRLDLAYVSYDGFADTALTAGKYKNVFFKPGGQQMIFDGDYRPEGVALEYERNSLFFNAGTMILESDDKFFGNDKASLWGLQVGYEIPLNNNASLTFGTSYYDAGIAGSRPFFLGLPYGNTVDDSGAYVYDYEELELFAEANFTFAGRPLRLYGDYVNNLGADDLNTGWMLGAKYGKAKGPNTWELGYSFRDLEADAVLGSLADSDFGGGGTDNVGHTIKAAYGIGSSAKLGLTYFINQYGEARLGEKVDYNRLQLDVQVSF